MKDSKTESLGGGGYCTWVGEGSGAEAETAVKAGEGCQRRELQTARAVVSCSRGI